MESWEILCSNNWIETGALKGSLQYLKGKMDKTNLYFSAFQKYLLRSGLDIDLSKKKTL
jgi:carboxyl-terminal processing protease